LGIDRTLLKFHCTGCGNCCREPLLPLTDLDVRRMMTHTQLRPTQLVRWVSAREIDLAHEPEAFVRLREGRRVMTLRHVRGGCLFIGSDQRCQIYEARPLGCRVFPLHTQFDRSGKLRRLELIQATAECPYDHTGQQRVAQLRQQQQAFLDEVDAYQAKVAGFNQLQRRRQQSGRPLQRAQDFFEFLGLA
jgi:Fe-S-cluster containining protein